MSIRLIIDVDRCKGCELCLDICPRQVLVISKSLNTSGSHFPQMVPGRECSGCRQCAIICPEAAIEIERISSTQQGKAPGTSRLAKKIKDGTAYRTPIRQLTAQARRQGHLTRQDIRERLKTLLDDEINLDDFVLLFREKGIDVHD